MKIIAKSMSSILRPHYFFVAYLAAGLVLLLGFQEFAHRKWGIVLSEEMIAKVAPIGSYLYGLAGWTLFGFVPMGLFLCWFTTRKLLGCPGIRDGAYCRWINELAVGLGLLGTIRGFIVVASGQGGGVSASPNDTLSAILVGMGSTFIGIALALWALLLQNPAEQT